jgi:hypothetical protein
MTAACLTTAIRYRSRRRASLYFSHNGDKKFALAPLAR